MKDRDRQQAGTVQDEIVDGQKTSTKDAGAWKDLDFRTLLETTTNIVFLLDDILNVQYVTPSVEVSLGWTSEELIQTPFANLIHPEGLKRFFQYHSRLKRKPGETFSLEFELHHKDGSWRYFDCSGCNFFHLPGIQGIAINARDITVERRAVKALRESERRYRLLAENVTDVIWTTNLNLKYTFVSPSIERVFGTTVEETMAMNVEDNLPPEDLKYAMGRFNEELEKEKRGEGDPNAFHTIEIRQYNKDRELIWTELTARFLHDSEGKSTGILGVTRDISERKIAEERIRNSENRARTLLNSADETVVLMDAEGRVLDINEVGARRLGFTPEKLTGKGIFDYLPDSVKDTRLDLDQTVFLSGQSYHFSDEQDGTVIEYSIYPVFESDGSVSAAAIFAKDVTERKRGEIELKKAHDQLEERVRERTAELVEANERLKGEIDQRGSIEDALMRRDAILQAVSFAAKLFLKSTFSGTEIYQALERLGNATKVSRVAVFEADEAQTPDTSLSLLQEWLGANVEYPFKESLFKHWIPKEMNMNIGLELLSKGNSVTRSKSDFDPKVQAMMDQMGFYSVMAVPIHVEDRFWGIITFHDKEENRVWSNAEEDALKTAANIMGAVIGRNLAEKALNESQRAMTTLLGNLPGMAYRCWHDPDWTMEFVSDGCFVLTGYQPEDLILNRKQSYGDCIHPEDRQMVWENVQKALEKKEPYTASYRIQTADGTIKWVWEQGTGVFNEYGDVQALEGLVIDISQRRKMEMAIESNTREIELYNDILAHDIGNINQTTLNNVKMLISEAFGPMNEEQIDLLNACKWQVYRTRSLIEKVKTLRQMSLADSEPFKAIDLTGILQMAIENVRSVARDKPLAIRFISERGKFVLADKLIQQLFFNLLENAVNHVRKKEIEIDITIHPTRHEGQACWKVAIEDNGPGIRDELKEIIFNRLEKGRGRKGSGIGLAIVKSLTKKYKGKVFVEDKVKGNPSKGSRFVLIIPKA